MSEYLESLVEHKRNEVARISDDIRLHMFNSPFEELNREHERKHNRGFIYESIFKEYYLPRMLGLVKDATWIGRWQTHAITLAASVEIIDDVTEEVKFVVPGILQTLKVGQYRQTGPRAISEVVGGSVDREGNKAYNSQGFLFKGLEPVADVVLAETNLDNERSIWLKIVNYYGYNPDGSTYVKEQPDTDVFLGDSTDTKVEEPTKDIYDDGVEFEF